MKNIAITILFISSTIFCLHAQMSNNWVMGRGARVDFNSIPPQVSDSMKLSTSHSSSSISDGQGNLLFYTAGDTIYNSDLKPMPNGENLIGAGKYSFQGIITVPYPGSPGKYVVFNVTVNEDTLYHPGKLLYGGLVLHVVDMSLDGGFGDIAVRDSIVLQPSDSLMAFEPRITAAKHANDTDYWIITRKWDGAGVSHFYNYLLDSTGLHPPIISGTGQTINGLGYQGQMKVAPDGSKIAMTAGKLSPATGMFDPNYLEVFCFNNQTGMVEPSILYEAADFGNMALSFSPNGKLLYFTGCGFGSICGAYQIDLDANTMVQVHSSPSNYMQLGPDGILYLNPSCTSSNCIDAILSPNKQGAACDYTSSYLTFSNPVLSIGLCNMVDADTGNSAPFIVDFNWQNIPNGCDSLTWGFVNANPGSATNWLWIVKDSNDAVIQTTNIMNPDLAFSTEGIYSIMLIGFESCKADTTIKMFSISNDGLNISVNSISICEGDSVFSGGGYQFVSGSYFDTLVAVNGCDSIIKTELSVLLSYSDSIKASICEGDSLLIGSNYESTAGIYQSSNLTINNCDSIVYVDLSVLQPIEPMIYANGNELVVIPATNGNCQWYLNGALIPGATSDSYLAIQPGTYSVMVTDSNGCPVLSSEYEWGIVGMLSKNSNSLVKVFPNPASSVINIEWKEDINFDPLEIRLVDLSGKEVLSGLFHSGAIVSIDLKDVVPGMYFMRMSSNGISQTSKIVIQ